MDSIKNIWQRNRLGSGMFIGGIALCIISAALSIILNISPISHSGYVSYLITMIGLGLPLIFYGSNTIMKYSEKNYISFLGFVITISFAILFFTSYSDSQYHDRLYVIYSFYSAGMLLLIVDTFLKINKKESDTILLLEETNKAYLMIKERYDMCKDEAVPDYISEFVKKLKEDIDSRTKELSDMTIRSIRRYKTDNDRLHDDVQKFKQRTEKEKSDFKDRANEMIIKDLVNVIVNIDELGQHKHDSNYTIDDIKRIKDYLFNILKDEEVEIINPSIGDNFDDKRCCAIETVENDKFPENKIVSVKKIGCLLRSGKVVKYADVVVSKNKLVVIPKDSDSDPDSDPTKVTKVTKVDNVGKEIPTPGEVDKK